MGGTEELSLPFLQEYQLSESQFRALLHGTAADGMLDEAWAVRKLFEQVPYAEMLQLIDLATLVRNWPRWRIWVDSISRRRGMDFLTAYLQYISPDTYGKPKNG